MKIEVGQIYTSELFNESAIVVEKSFYRTIENIVVPSIVYKHIRCEIYENYDKEKAMGQSLKVFVVPERNFIRLIELNYWSLDTTPRKTNKFEITGYIK